MPVDTTHPDYDQAAPFWERLRDAAEGEDAVRAKGSTYLPPPPGLKGGVSGRAFETYLKRARYPEAVGPTIEGMLGLMDRVPPSVDLPSGIEYLRSEATPDGLTLDGLLKRIRHNVCTVARHVLLVDVLEGEQSPRIASYDPEALINWRCEDGKVTLAVLHEPARQPKDDDPYVEETVDQYRVCYLDDDGRYAMDLFRRVQSDQTGETRFEPVRETAYPTRRGDYLDEVPLVIIGSRDLTAEPDAMPLLGVANKSLHYYRQYADYAQQLSLSSMGTTAYVTGVGPDDDQAPQTVGPGTIWYLPENADCGYLEISGAGLDAQRQELDRIQREIATAAVQALGDKGNEAESGEALRLRMQSQTATLSSIATTTAAGLREALAWCAWWDGQDEASVTVEQGTSFVSEQPDSQLLTALFDGVERGLVPIHLIPRYLRNTGITDENEQELMRWMPSAQAATADEDEL